MGEKLESIRHVTYQCSVCREFFKSEQLCQTGIDDFVPPDPLPRGSKVHRKGAVYDAFWRGEVVSSQVVNADRREGGHRHVRWVRVQHGRGWATTTFSIEKRDRGEDLEWELASE